MKLLPKIFNKRSARERWEAGLTWFRLRYQEPTGPIRCINLLSRPAASGRIALYAQPAAPVMRLFVGIASVHAPLLAQMAADFGFSLKPAPPEMILPPVQPMAAVRELPWARPFVAHIADGTAFVSVLDEKGRHGTYLPEPSRTQDHHGWQLPAAPGTGLTTRPSWNGHKPPDELIVAVPDPEHWLLGRTPSGVLLQAAGRVNVLGRPRAAADWLIHLITQTLLTNPADLVVIDGEGDLVPQLKRKATVTRLLGQQLIYFDIDDDASVSGINPLAAVPGEAEEALLRRWQHWFCEMNVHPQGVGLLTQAREDGVTDIPSLRQWLKKAERQGHHAEVATLASALNGLAADRTLRERLAWPASGTLLSPGRAHLFACKGESWARQQLQRALSLAAMDADHMRLILHGVPWRKDQAKTGLSRRGPLIVINGPLLPDSTIVMVESDAEDVSDLTARFLSDDPVLGENLQLLGKGEGIVITAGKDVFHVSWQS